MEYLAKIIQEQKVKSGLFYKYDFVNLQTGQEDSFLNNYRVNYIPDYVGKLNLIESNKHPKLFQSFEQDITNTAKEFQQVGSSEDITDLGKKIEKEVNKASNAYEKSIKLTSQLLNKAHYQLKISWRKLAKTYGVSLSTIQRKRKETNRPKQKRGRKQKISGNNLVLLRSYIFKNPTSTQQKMAGYLSEIGLTVNQATICRTIDRAKITRQVIPYRHPQQKALMPQFWEFVNELVPTLPKSRILATDESGFSLSLALRYGYASKGQKVNAYCSTYSKNYSLILLIQNVAGKGIIHWQLVKGAVNTEIFYNFLASIKLPTNERYYLLMDNIRFHHAKKIKELLTSMNIAPTYIVPYFPQLNPIEEIFNVIKQYVRKYQPKTEEELRSILTEIITKLQGEDLTKYFQNCLCCDFAVSAGS